MFKARKPSIVGGRPRTLTAVHWSERYTIPCSELVVSIVVCFELLTAKVNVCEINRAAVVDSNVYRTMTVHAHLTILIGCHYSHRFIVAVEQENRVFSAIFRVSIPRFVTLKIILKNSIINSLYLFFSFSILHIKRLN